MFEQHPGEDFAANDETSMVNWQGNATASLVPARMSDGGFDPRWNGACPLPACRGTSGLSAGQRVLPCCLSHEAIRLSPVRKHRRR